MEQVMMRTAERKCECVFVTPSSRGAQLPSFEKRWQWEKGHADFDHELF